MEKDIIKIIKNLQANSIKNSLREAPIDYEEIVKIENHYKITLPEDYKKFLLTYGSGSIIGKNRGICFESYLFGWNDDEEFSIPGMFAIGTDMGGAIYYYDTKNELGYGPYALFIVHLGSLSKEYSRFVGYSLKEVIINILNGESFFDRPTWSKSV